MKPQAEIITTIKNLKKKLLLEPTRKYDMGYRLGVKQGLEWVMNQKTIQIIDMANLTPLDPESP